MKKLCKLFLLCSLVLGIFATTNVALAKEEASSIDAVSGGVADTGETKFEKKGDKKLEECKVKYSVAVLPYIDASGLEGRSREMAVNAIKETLKKKYPGKKKSANTIASAKAVANAVKEYPYENPDSPVLEELVTLGKAIGVDRVIYINMLPVRTKETGFMVVVGSQTYSSVVAMKLKCVDVKEEKYLFNNIVEEIGSSTSVNFWKIGSASQAKSVKRGTTECMTDFLTAFD